MQPIPFTLIGPTGVSQVIYLRLSATGEPVVLGTGRFASVVLASRDKEGTGSPLAVKFLKRDESDNASRIARDRFLEEFAVNWLLNDDSAKSFINFAGFSCIADSLTSVAANSVLATIPPGSRNIPLDLLVSIAKANYHESRRTEKLASFTDRHQDALLVMEAASLSLDELLHHRGRISDLAIFRRQTSPSIEPAKDLPFETSHGRSLSEESVKKQAAINGCRRQLQTTAESTGFDVLKALANSRFGDAGEITILSLWSSIVSTVEQVHTLRFRDGPGSFAHRDLKPNNILMGDVWSDTPSVKLSDLGHVGGVEKISDVKATQLGSPRDPGVLPGGSAGFRSPEQIVNGAEVVFWIAQEGGDSTGTEIFSRPLGDVRIEDGDTLETSDLPFKDGQLKVKITHVDDIQAGGEQRCALMRPWEKHTTRSSYRGNVIKPVGQQSDIFSLGCLLYYLVSGGLNPEKFYAKVLEVDSSWRPRQKVENCLEIALRYCDEDLFRLQHQFDALAPHLQSIGILTADQCDSLRSMRFRFDRRVLGDAAKQRRADPVIARYLRNASNRPISLPVLYLVVACMERGLKDSFVPKYPGCPEDDLRSATARMKTLAYHFIANAFQKAANPLDGLHRDVTTAFLHIRCL